MTININNVIPVEVKDLDITQFTNIKDTKTIIQVRHFTRWEQNEIDQIGSEGQEYDHISGRVILKNTKNLNKMFVKEMIYGVVAKTCPFGKWNEEAIKQIDEKSSRLIDHIYTAIKEFNRPLAMKK